MAARMSAEMPVHDRQSAFDFLFGRINYERTSLVPYTTGEFKLDRIRRLLAALGDPHKKFPAIHIAGTKGKGSTAAMMASILQVAGYRVGLYTSPHLNTLEERFVINGQLCSDQEFVSLVQEIQKAVHHIAEQELSGTAPPMGEHTFFEITTALGLLHFARQKVDAAVLEVGLGGRLDSTNVCLPAVCIITTISFDHTRQLGNTLALIAAEKAGIIKPGIPVVSGVTNDEPRDVIRAIAAQQNAPLYERSIDFDTQSLFASESGAVPAELAMAGYPFKYLEPATNPTYSLAPLQLKLLGQHQMENAAGVIRAARLLAEQGWKISESHIREGLTHCSTAGRIEILSQHPTILIDVAHNVASVAAVSETIKQRFTNPRRILIFASSKDKDAASMMQMLAPHFSHIILTKYLHNPRAFEPAELLALAPTANPELSNVTWEIQAEPKLALDRAKSLANREDLICATGSFFLASELRPLLTP